MRFFFWLCTELIGVFGALFHDIPAVLDPSERLEICNFIRAPNIFLLPWMMSVGEPGFFEVSRR